MQAGGESRIRVVKLKKGTRGMSWRRKAMKGVEGCEKPGRAVKQALIPGFPNDSHPNIYGARANAGN